MKRKLFGGLLVLVALAILIYIADFAIMKFRIAKGSGAYGTFTVRSYYAIAKKANKVEYDYIGSEQETCTHSLFPHFGFNPCWFVSRHTERRIEI